MNDECLSKRANKGHVLGGGVEKEEPPKCEKGKKGLDGSWRLVP